jgi:polyphosphate kinase
MTAKASTRVGPLELLSKLVDCGNVDTVYRDVYLGRGRTLLANEFPLEEFRRTEQQEAELATLAPTIGRAIEKGDWLQVKELSGRAEALRRSVESQRGRMETALSRSASVLPSRERWFDYSRARDMMLKATDTKHAPWLILRSDDKRRARLNCIAHLLKLIPYKKVPHEKIKLPKRSKKGAYDDQSSLDGRKFVPERY